MKETHIAVLGGDRRELILISALCKRPDYHISCCGQGAESLPERARYAASPQEALRGADILILPMAGISAYGMVYNAFGHLLRLGADELTLMRKGGAVLSGIACDHLREICQNAGKRLITTADLEAVAAPNSIPTAEGAISLAIKNSPETLNGSKSLVIGYGRVGRALSCRLRALGSDVYICDKSAFHGQKAENDGYTLLVAADFEAMLAEFDYIFNTAPAPVLNGACLRHVRREALLMDLASLPGGVDAAAAGELGLNYLSALGLPGRFAPVSAGKILAAVYPGLIDEFMRKGETGNG